MAKPQTIVGRTEILATIYDPDTLPTAIFAPDGHTPFCVHSLRESDLSFFEKTFMENLRCANGVASNNAKKDEELKVKFYRFYEDYPEQDHTCIGCLRSEQIDEGHLICDSESVCKKTTEDCA